MKSVFKAILGVVVALGLALPVAAAERAIIVLDGSGSMWAQIDGVARITIARETLSSVLSTLPDDLELGLMTYGHRERGNCADIQMLVAPGAGTANAIVDAANRINPRGMTPLSDAVRMAAEELRFTEQRATVILITDGLETCEIDPCRLGTDLEAQGIDFTAHVLGFGLSDDEGRQVACLAENTGGRYLSATDGASLVDALTETVAQVTKVEPEPAPAPEPEPAPAPEFNILPTASLAEGGPDLVDDLSELVWSLHTVAANGGAGEWLANEYKSGAKLNAEPGSYILRAEYGAASAEQPIEIVEGEVIEPHVVLNAGTVTVRVFSAEGEPVNSDGFMRLHYPGGDAPGWGKETFHVPAGEQRLEIELGQGRYAETFTLAAGETVTRDIVVGVGVAVIDAAYVEGQLVTSNDLHIRIYGAQKALDGSRQEFGYEFGPGKSHDLPAGDYVAHIELEAAEVEVPFTVRVGERVEVVGILNAGVAAFTTPNVDVARVYGAATAIDGSRREFAYEFSPNWQTTLNEGDYIIRVQFRDGSEREVPFTVTAGQRTELTVEASAGKPSSD